MQRKSAKLGKIGPLTTVRKGWPRRRRHFQPVVLSFGMRIRYCRSILGSFTDPPKKIDRGALWSTPGSCENTWQSRTLNAHTRIRKINLGFDNRVSATIFVICIVANGLRIVFRSPLCGDVLFGTTLSQGVNRIALNSIPKDQYQMRVTLQPYRSLTSLTVIQAGMLRWPDGWRHLLFFRYSNTLCAQTQHACISCSSRIIRFKRVVGKM